jgi:cytochrome c oxidase assembly factor 1
LYTGNPNFNRFQKRWPLILAFASAGLTGWAIFLLFATNHEKLSNSVVRQIIRTVRENPALQDLLGDAIRPEPAWYLNGDPRINGKVSVSFTCCTSLILMLSGLVDE